MTLSIFKISGGLFAAAALTAALPAYANSAADVTGELKADVATDASAATGMDFSAGDEDFAALFADWKALDTRSEGKVAIPSGLPVRDFVMTSEYGYRSDPFGGSRRRHKGIDMAGPVGTPIYATADGIIGRAQWVGGYGRYVEINHGGEMQTRYGHMSRLNVEANQRVKKGEIIGYMGSTGRSTGSHLHYEVRLAGESVNPVPFLQSSDYLVALQERANEGKGGPDEE